MGKSGTSVWRIELREICKILIDNGVDIKKITTRKNSSNGKRVPTTLKDISIEGIDIDKIIMENDLDGNFPIGKYLRQYRLAYNGTQGNLTKEEREEGERLGIVVKRNEHASKPIFKGGKMSQFHLDFINGILDRILSGEINTREALNLLRQASIENNEIIIEDGGSIKKCVEILLKDRPEEINKYNEIVRKNSGKRSPYKGKKGKPKIGLYHQREEEFKKYIIDHYLPLILSGEITLKNIAKELSTTNVTINEIIEEFYSRTNDMDGLEEYRHAKRKNLGIIQKKQGQIRREKVYNYNVVINAEFTLLSPEEQEKQLIMKIRLEQLKEEKSNTNKVRTALVSEDVVIKRINAIMNYFRSKNDSGSGEIYFSDQDIRFMIFKYPTLTGRTLELLDEKLNVFTSYEEIDEKTAYGMIKEFPALMGYDASRTKKQLDVLKMENLMDAVIFRPSILMNSVNLNYALIQYAKERHHTSDLSNINRSNIFMANSTLKRVYGVSHDEIKAKYPYIIEEQQKDGFTVTTDEIAKATYSSRTKSKEAEYALKQALQDKEKGTQE